MPGGETDVICIDICPIVRYNLANTQRMIGGLMSYVPNPAIEVAAKLLDMTQHPLFQRRITYGMALNDKKYSSVSVDYDIRDVAARFNDGDTITLIYNSVKQEDPDCDLKVGDDHVYFDCELHSGLNHHHMRHTQACKAYLAYMNDMVDTRAVIEGLVRDQVSIKDITGLLTQIGSRTYELGLTVPDKPVLLVIGEHFVALGKLWDRRQSALSALKEVFDGEIKTVNGNEQDKIYWWFAYHHLGIKCIGN